MKAIFIPAKSRLNLDKIKELNINEKVGLITTVQYVDYLKEINKIIKKSVIGGQILGCNVDNAIKIKKKVDSYLYVGSGKFHPIEVAYKTDKKVYVFNPNTNEFSWIGKIEVDNYKNRKKGAYLRFLNAKKIGILVSIKHGQYNLDLALNLKKKLNKESYIFIGNEIKTDELENFRDIDCWINTACPRIEGRNVINVEDLNF